MIPHPNPKVNIPALSRIPCRNLRKLPPKGGIGYDSWNGIGDRGAAAQCQRGGREAVRAGQMRHAASDGPGPHRGEKWRTRPADGRGVRIPALPGVPRGCGGAGRGGKKWLTNPRIYGNMSGYNPTKGDEGKSNRLIPHRESGC